MQLTFQPLAIPLRLRIKQASADRAVSDSIYVEARDSSQGIRGVGEGCPRPYQTGETTPSALEWLRERQAELEALDDLDALRRFHETRHDEIDLHPAAWCGVELALLDAFGQGEGCTVEQLLGVSETKTTFRYAAVISDESGPSVRELVRRFVEAGLTDFKFKLSGDLARDTEKLTMLQRLSNTGERYRVRLDANNLWGNDTAVAIAHLAQLPGPIAAIEEPFTPGLAQEMAQLAQSLDVAVVLDESLLKPTDIPRFAALDASWVGSVKVSKAGGLLRSLELVKTLGDASWPILVSAQTGETSILTRAAMVVARAAAHALYGQEGGLGTLLLERDVVTPELRMGRRGVIDLADVKLGSRGFGLSNP